MPISCLFLAQLQTDFSLAKSEPKKKQPIIDATAQDSDGNYIDQIALDSISYGVKNVVKPPQNYSPHYYKASDEFRQTSKEKAPPEQKVHYITPEPHNFSQDYIHHALNTREKSKEKGPVTDSFLESSTLSQDGKNERKLSTPKRKKIQSFDYNDYNFFFPESKRIIAKSTSTSISAKDSVPEKHFPSQSPNIVVTKDKTKINGDQTIDTYHYFYPEDSSFNNENVNFVPPTFSTTTTTTTMHPRVKSSSKRKSQSTQSSTDSYQYQPVLLRPNDYTPTDYSNQDFVPIKHQQHNEKFTTSTHSPIGILKPTRRNKFHTSSTPTTSKPIRVRRPSSFNENNQFSSMPSLSDFPEHPSASPVFTYYSSTRSPEVSKYSTPSSITSTNFHINHSTQLTSSGTPSTIDINSNDNKNDEVVYIKPRSHYQNSETIAYKFIPEDTLNFNSNKSENIFYSTVPSLPEIHQSSKQSNQSNDNFFSDNHQKNVNFEFFTEQDAAPMLQIDDKTMKMDQPMVNSHDVVKASKKNMFYSIDPEASEYSRDYLPSSMMTFHENHHQNREVPSPQNVVDNKAEESKSQYFVVYSVDDEERKKGRKLRRKVRPEPEFHDKDFENFNSEINFELKNSDNVRIVDPNVRGGQPIEFSKDDYLRHIKQAVVQYMKENDPRDSQSAASEVKNFKYQEIPHRSKKNFIPATTLSPYRNNLQYKSKPMMKSPKNLFSPPRLKEMIEDTPKIDLTLKKIKQKPIDLSAIDVGSTYQHISHFDHSAALRNVEEFDQSNVVSHHQGKPKLRFSQKTYHDINNLGYDQTSKHSQVDDLENDETNLPLSKGYSLSDKYSLKRSRGTQDASNFASINYEGKKIPKTISILNGDDHDDAEDVMDAPIQIINGIPVANPYNIDLNTIKYMLGGIAQAEVNDQLEESATHNEKFPSEWNTFSPDEQLETYSFKSPVIQIYNQHDKQQRGNKSFRKAPNKNNQSPPDFNKNRNKMKNIKGSHQNFESSDSSGWQNRKNKKQRLEASSLNSRYALRPAMNNKQASNQRNHLNASKTRSRQPQLVTELRPPPQIIPKTHFRLKKVL
ncbi:CLUMA_CG010595, isoform A [Clunio marinus]|uniref:CLUMA_CG010595, isoform A n=1 Tax=Clunio marinus TaxID=568069 RepID=A0A1J1IDX2_9DIPT|nr:CLUMA_CG010595, isoform A [Clunio marinus]